MDAVERRAQRLLPGILAAFPALIGSITRMGLAPYDVPARRGELKHVIVTEAGEIRITRHHPVGERALLPRLQGMHGHTRGLVEDHHRVVFVDDGERDKRIRHDHQIRFLEELFDADFVTRLQSHALGGSLAVQQNQALRYGFLRQGTR